MRTEDARRAPEPRGARLEVLLIIDPIDTLHAAHDTSVAIMEAAQRMGHRVSVTTVPELSIDGAVAVARCHPTDVHPAVLDQGRWVAVDDWYEQDTPSVRPLAEFDAVFMRTDPPVDDAYLRATFILDFVDPRSTLVLNSPAGLRHANEKLFALRVPEIGPPTFLSADKNAIIERVRRWGKAVLKPTNAMAGRGILVLEPDDVNLHSIIDGATERGRHQVVVQRWIDDVIDGDRRVIVIDGEPKGAVRRVALGDDFRCNMAAGAATVRDVVTDADRALCERLAPLLRAHGLIFVGLDVIGGRVTEVNVTSPTGVREIDALSGTDLAGDLMTWVELACGRRLEAKA
ncbi:glutathione synthase [Nocardia farcinica]|uniref:glutathione synthase n=1 Tax=Nocardia farcinica TaxID=37329 RepID=UPI001B3C572F|nr:glutathione synthase [Nocardia farcinica]MBF6535970.1 glutathione synthase [Nocardia farcinica]